MDAGTVVKVSRAMQVFAMLVGCLSTMLYLLVCTLSTAVAGEGSTETCIFNGRDLKGWSGNQDLWKVEHGHLVGRSSHTIRQNVFLWSDISVKDFYLSVWVRLTPDDRNSGIQFRSTKARPSGAHGYQADIGHGFWGRLYHETGRGKLSWHDTGERTIKPDEWNHYEILAVGHHIWMAVNGTLSVALNDPEGELQGHIALQIHSGPPQTVRFKKFKLIQNPKIELAGHNEADLVGALHKDEPSTPQSGRTTQ